MTSAHPERDLLAELRQDPETAQWLDERLAEDLAQERRAGAQAAATIFAALAEIAGMTGDDRDQALAAMVEAIGDEPVLMDALFQLAPGTHEPDLALLLDAADRSTVDLPEDSRRDPLLAALADDRWEGAPGDAGDQDWDEDDAAARRITAQMAEWVRNREATIDFFSRPNPHDSTPPPPKASGVALPTQPVFSPRGVFRDASAGAGPSPLRTMRLESDTSAYTLDISLLGRLDQTFEVSLRLYADDQDTPLDRDGWAVNVTLAGRELDVIAGVSADSWHVGEALTLAEVNRVHYRVNLT